MSAGNWLQITDARGGVHRYRYLDRLCSVTNVQPPREFRRGETRFVRQHIAFAGNSAVGQKHATGVRGAARTTLIVERWGATHTTTSRPIQRGYRLDYALTFSLRCTTDALRHLRRARRPGAYGRSPGSRRPHPPAPHTPGAPTVTTGQRRSLRTPRTCSERTRSTSTSKSATAVAKAPSSLAFNPYVVPWLPCATFDRRSSAVDTFGYVGERLMDAHTSPHGDHGMFPHGRTFQEMFSLMQRTYATSAARIGLAQTELETAVVAQDQSVWGASRVR